MLKLAEVLPSRPTPLWKLCKQIGIDHVVSGLGIPEGGEAPWSLGPLRRLKEEFDRGGFDWQVIESSPPMQKIRLGLPGRDEETEWFCDMLRAMGQVGVPVVCYNFMAVLGWMRTYTDGPGRGGALVTGYRSSDVEPGLTDAGEVSEERVWDNLTWFLERVVPVAEKAGVKLAMHPDDPPLSPLRGIGRIMRSVDGFQRLLDIVPSEANGLTLCQGNFALMTSDLPGVIREFGRQGRLHFSHFRDVRGTAEQFEETFHDEGPTDMLECVRAYRDIGFDGPMRPDHVPTLEGDSNDNPCYSSAGRLFAVGYIKGLMEAVYGPAARRAAAAWRGE
ncbi:MAG: mannonate dehydratase [Armatimonadetes bacterium]|nr:mannonate dehydratase [Armatimonadota bacterium]